MVYNIFGFDYIFDISFFQLCLLASLLGLVSKFLLTYVNIDYFATGNNQILVFSLLPVTGFVITSAISNNIALSLGMVGALSIVRFRTPIKEPEDLAYLFICIAAGVGLGAGAVLATSMAIIFILVVFTIFLQFTEKKNLFPHYLTISKNKNTEIKDVDEMIKIISKFCDDQPTIRRIDYNQDSVDVLIHISLPKDNKMIEMLSTLRIKFSNTEFTVLDQSKNILT